MNAGMNLNLPRALGGTVPTDTSVGFGELLSHINFAELSLRPMRDTTDSPFLATSSI